MKNRQVRQSKTSLILGWVACSLWASCATPAPDAYDAKWEDPFVFYGTTQSQNRFSDLDAGQGTSVDALSGPNDPDDVESAVRILAIPVIASDHEAIDMMELSDWIDSKQEQWRGTSHAFWREASFGKVGVVIDWIEQLQVLPNAFQDYYFPDFVPATLTTSGLAQLASINAPSSGGAKAVLQVRSNEGVDRNLEFFTTGPFADAAALAQAWQTNIDAMPDAPEDWLTAKVIAGEIQFSLAKPLVGEASFIRVSGGSALGSLGLDGPLSKPGDSSANPRASLLGKPVPASTFSSGGLLDGQVEVEFFIRNHIRRWRRALVKLPQVSVANAADISQLLLDGIKAELGTSLNWVKTIDAGDSVGLQIRTAQSGKDAAIFVSAGKNLTRLGLDGPLRVDGMTTFDDRRTVRGTAARIPGQAVSAAIQWEAAAQGIAIEAIQAPELRALVDKLISNEEGILYDSIMPVFVEGNTTLPTNFRAAANSLASWNAKLKSGGDYTFLYQKKTGIIIGLGDMSWTTVTHEVGHVLELPDEYPKEAHDEEYERKFDFVNEWGVMARQRGAPHPIAWDKQKKGWIKVEDMVTMEAAPADEFVTAGATLVPVERMLSEYEGLGDTKHPLVHAMRLNVVGVSGGDVNFIYVENRQEGELFSKKLPFENGKDVNSVQNDVRRGGVWITDTVNHWNVEPDERRHVMVLSSGKNETSVGLFPGATLHLAGEDQVNPFPGNIVRVVGSVPGPAGAPPAMRVEVDRGPGEFVDLEIRSWAAPDVYGTYDIWIDWPGNGVMLVPMNANPPLGNGERPHWHKDKKSLNHVMVRVHNRGTADATGVVVSCELVEAGMGNGNYEMLDKSPSQPMDIPAGEARDFKFDWYPGEDGHFCLRAKIVSHTSNFPESTTSNNIGKENVTQWVAEKGSPYQPVDFSFEIRNSTSRPATYDWFPVGLLPGLDLAVSERSVLIPAGGSHTIETRLMVDEALWPPDIKSQRLINLLAFQRTADSYYPHGGISVILHPTTKSKLSFKAGTPLLRDPDGQRLLAVSGQLSGNNVVGQRIDIAVMCSDDISRGTTTIVNTNGQFEALIAGVPPGSTDIMAYYFGPAMGPSVAEINDVEIP